MKRALLPLMILCLASCTHDIITDETIDETLADPGLSWSDNSCTVTVDGDNTFPTLTNTFNLPVKYSSSNTDVATIDNSGNVSIVANGEKTESTTITAKFAGNDTYRAASASYTLIVRSSNDDGVFTGSFRSSGDPSSEDDISTCTFTRIVSVEFGSGGAKVSGYEASAELTVNVDGNKVTITNSGTENIVYKLSGTASDGSFKLYSEKKQAIWLSDLQLTCSSGAAIDNQSGKRTYIYVDGTNTLADGSSAAYTTTGEEDMKGVLFSEGQIIFSGEGSLTVTANNQQSKSAIVSDDYVRFMDGPSIKVTSNSKAGHGVKGKEYVRISGGTLEIGTAAAMKKGITSEDYVLVEGGTTTIEVTGGTAYDSEDQEYKGSAGIKADNYFAMTGGSVTITNTGSGGKGVRAGSYDFDETTHKVADSYISGGTLTITTSGSESNDVSSKGIKIGWVTKTTSGRQSKVSAYAGNLNISGGKVTVSASKSEGIEAKGNIVISGGEVHVTSSGDDAINSQAEFDVTGGYVFAQSSANDAMDANHDMKLSGGYVFAICTKGGAEMALDANTEENYKLYIQSGATIVAYGSLERGYSAAQTINTFSVSAGSWNALYNGSQFIAAFKVPSGLSSLVVSAPSLTYGYTDVSVSGTQLCNGIWAADGISGGKQTTLGTYSGSSGGGPGGGGGRW